MLHISRFARLLSALLCARRPLRVGILAALLLICGCHAGIKETHYFASYAPDKPTEPVSFFRLLVDGDVQFSNARYVAGFYDERAVDLFFNQIKPSGDAQTRSLFEAQVTEPGTSDLLKPLSPGDRGAFVLVLSSNADAIANAIGSFAESQEVANNISTMLNRKDLNKASQTATQFTGEKALATAFAMELESVLSDSNLKASAVSAKAAMLRGLNLIAQTLGASQSFSSIDEVRTWLSVRRTLTNQGSMP